MRGAADIVYRRIEPQLSEYMGAVFEGMCKQYLWKLLLDGNSPVEFSELGRWWGNDPIEKKQTEIDIMGEQDKKTALFGECKWTTQENGKQLTTEPGSQKAVLIRRMNSEMYLL